MSLADLGVAELARGIRTGDVTAGQVLEDCLARIEERNPRLNAFSQVLTDSARAEAAALDEAWTPDLDAGPLYGVPVAIKDEIAVEGVVTTFGGRGNSSPAPRDSEVVRRLRAAGAVIIGTTRMPEFGIWPFTESRAGGITRNPWDRTRTPGGSSGGTAVAVAAGMVPVGLGGDGGGSIRLPSACVGIFGLKPSRGRVSADPMPHLWWTLSGFGPLARSVLDSALVYDVIRGNVPGDRFTAPEPSVTFTEAAGREPGRLRIGWSTQATVPGVRPHLQSVRAVRETAALLARLGHEVREVEMDYPDTTAVFVPQFLRGIRDEAVAMEHPELLEPRTRHLAALGRGVSERTVEWAERASEELGDRMERRFGAMDVLLTPTMPIRPRPVGVLDRGGILRQALNAAPMIANAAFWNITGNPAASVPAGIAPDGLPLAVQLVGRRNDEPTVLSLSAQLERERPWRLPPWNGR